MTNIDKLAQDVVSCEMAVAFLAQQNVQREHDKRLAQDIQYRLAKAALVAARKAYEDELTRLSHDELMELADIRRREAEHTPQG